MPCHRIDGAIICTRERRRPAAERPRCRHLECARYATQARYACRTHWFRLPPGLRDRLYRAARDDQHGEPWRMCADEADRWFAEQLARPPAPAWRQPELPL